MLLTLRIKNAVAKIRNIFNSAKNLRKKLKNMGLRNANPYPFMIVPCFRASVLQRREPYRPHYPHTS